MTSDWTKCPKCGYKKALTHYSSCNITNWIACPKCRTFFEHGKEEEYNNKEFWKNVEEDTGYTKTNERMGRTIMKDQKNYYTRCNKCKKDYETKFFQLLKYFLHKTICEKQ